MPGGNANIIPVLDRLQEINADRSTLARGDAEDIEYTTNGRNDDARSEIEEVDARRSLSQITTQSMAASPTFNRASPSENESIHSSVWSLLPSVSPGLVQESSAPQSTITVLIVSDQDSYPPKPSGASLIPIVSGGRRADFEALPSRSQDLRTPDKSTILSRPTTSGLPTESRLRYDAALVRPLPGKNQPRPIFDAVAPASFLQLDEPVSTSMPSISQIVPEAELSLSSSQWSSLAPFGSISAILSIPTPKPSSFVTITRGQREYEESLAPFDGVQTATTVSAALPLSILPPSALVTTVIAASPSMPPNVAASANVGLQEGSRLTPIARAFFIVFGVLGEHIDPLSTHLN
jgi:hypothetical protein